MQWKRYLQLVKPCEVAENWTIAWSIRCCGRKLEFLILLPVWWRFLLILVFTCLIFTLHVNKTFFIKEEHYVKWFQQTWNQQKKSTASVRLHSFVLFVLFHLSQRMRHFQKLLFTNQLLVSSLWNTLLIPLYVLNFARVLFSKDTQTVEIIHNEA